GRGRAALRHLRDLGALVVAGVLAAQAEGRREADATRRARRLDDGEDDVGILAQVPVEADAAELRVGKPRGDLLPVLAAVAGLVQAGLRPVAPGRLADVVDVAPAVPGGDEHRLRVVGVHAHVDDAGLLVEVEDLLPVLAAVAG